MVYAVQGEKNARKIRFDLFNNGVQWVIDRTASVLVSYKKPDGHGGMYDVLDNGESAFEFAEDSTNSVIITLAEQVLTTVGNVSLLVSFMVGDEILSTFSIVLDVSENPGIDVAESVDYFSLSVAIEAAKQVAGDMFDPTKMATKEYVDNQISDINETVDEAKEDAKTFYVKITEQDGVFTADKSIAVIDAAYKLGRSIKALVFDNGDEITVPLSKISESDASFSGINGNTAYDIKIDNYGRIDFSEMILSEGNTGGSGSGSVNSVNGIQPDGNGDVDLTPSVYDLKDGYSYTENVYISEDGTETALTGEHYKCFDYIPVRNGISYTMYGCGYALYDSQQNFISAVYEDTGNNRIREFTPTENGFVRLTINCDDVAYARFCKTDEKYLEPYDYEPNPSPFFDPKIPCDVHLYGDSNSDTSWMEEPEKAWSSRFGSLVTSMKKGITNRRFCAFAEKNRGSTNYILRNTGYIRFTAYTDLFGVATADVGEIEVWIDGVKQDSIVTSGSKTFNFDNHGSHTIELRGISGINSVSSIGSKKQRSFTNHAIYGTGATVGKEYEDGSKWLFSEIGVPDGNVAIVMYAANDRQVSTGYYYEVVADFVRRCKAAGIIVYTFAPAPVNVGGESDPTYKQTMNDVIAQLPSDCMNVYGDMQLAAMLCGQELFVDKYHLNELGHKILYAAVAAKLQLAPPLSEVLHEMNNNPGNDNGDYLPNSGGTLTGPVTVTDGEVKTRVGSGYIDFMDANNEGVSLRHIGDKLLRLSTNNDEDARLIVGRPKNGNEAVPKSMHDEITEQIGASVPQIDFAKPGQVAAVVAVDNNGVPYSWEAVDLPTGGNGSSGSSYTLPVATPNTLGGVKPATKTEDMTQSVGVDENGGLWTVPGSGGNSDWSLLETINIIEDVNRISIDCNSNYSELCILVRCAVTNADASESGGFVNVVVDCNGASAIQNRPLFYKNINVFLTSLLFTRKASIISAEGHLYASTLGGSTEQDAFGAVVGNQIEQIAVSVVDSSLMFKAGGIVEVYAR